jgi:hypothetical protein
MRHLISTASGTLVVSSGTSVRSGDELDPCRRSHCELYSEVVPNSDDD